VTIALNSIVLDVFHLKINKFVIAKIFSSKVTICHGIFVFSVENTFNLDMLVCHVYIVYVKSVLKTDIQKNNK
jgi:hypothetical protein